MRLYDLGIIAFSKILLGILVPRAVAQIDMHQCARSSNANLWRGNSARAANRRTLSHALLSVRLLLPVGADRVIGIRQKFVQQEVAHVRDIGAPAHGVNSVLGFRASLVIGRRLIQLTSGRSRPVQSLSGSRPRSDARCPRGQRLAKFLSTCPSGFPRTATGGPVRPAYSRLSQILRRDSSLSSTVLVQ
jgi:hypothetical protein